MEFGKLFNRSCNQFQRSSQGASGAKMSEASGGDPLARHDGSPRKPSDAPRKKNAGLHHGIRAALSLVKADWKAFKEIFSFPGWQGNEGICWLCRATLQDMRTKTSTTDQPLTHWTFLHRQIHEYGKPVSQLLAAPTLRIHQFKPDWLHTMDQGCTADFLGNLFVWIVLPKLPGSNQGERVRQLSPDPKVLFRECCAAAIQQFDSEDVAEICQQSSKTQRKSF